MINANAMTTNKATVTLLVLVTFVDLEFEHTPGTKDVLTLPNGDPGNPGEEQSCSLTETEEKLIWYEDHLIADTPENAGKRHLLLSSLRQPEHADEIQRQLLLECEE